MAVLVARFELRGAVQGWQVETLQRPKSQNAGTLNGEDRAHTAGVLGGLRRPAGGCIVWAFGAAALALTRLLGSADAGFCNFVHTCFGQYCMTPPPTCLVCVSVCMCACVPLCVSVWVCTPPGEMASLSPLLPEHCTPLPVGGVRWTQWWWWWWWVGLTSCHFAGAALAPWCASWMMMI